jgi:hypothetical protein
MKAVNGLLDSNSVKKGTQVTSDSIRASFASIVDNDASKMKFEKILQSAQINLKKTVEAHGYKTQEALTTKIAQEELERQVVEHGSVDLSEEKLKDFSDRFFHRALNEGAITGSNGQPVHPSEEEIKAWKKEFTESFISSLISENLLQTPKKQEKNEPEKQIEAVLISLPKQTSIEGENTRVIDKEIARGILKDAITSQSLVQDLLTQIRKQADVERQEEKELQALDLKLADIKIKQIKKEEVKSSVLKAEQAMRVTKNLIERREVNILKKEKTKVSVNPEEPPLEMIDLTREKRPS